MFNEVFEKLIGYEGGYVDDIDDPGGETYKGVSRKHFPKWEGWLYVDGVKGKHDFPTVLESNVSLQTEVLLFYKTEFWYKMNCGVMPPKLAEEIFECSVNLGKERATVILQTALNILNNNQKHYKNIHADGLFGNITLSTMKVCISKIDDKLLFNVLNFLQASFYLELMLTNEVKEKFIGWFNRIEIIK